MLSDVYVRFSVSVGLDAGCLIEHCVVPTSLHFLPGQWCLHRVPSSALHFIFCVSIWFEVHRNKEELMWSEQLVITPPIT